MVDEGLEDGVVGVRAGTERLPRLSKMVRTFSSGPSPPKGPSPKLIVVGLGTLRTRTQKVSPSRYRLSAGAEEPVGGGGELLATTTLSTVEHEVPDPKDGGGEEVKVFGDTPEVGGRGTSDMGSVRSDSSLGEES